MCSENIKQRKCTWDSLLLRHRRFISFYKNQLSMKMTVCWTFSCDVVFPGELYSSSFGPHTVTSNGCWNYSHLRGHLIDEATSWSFILVGSYSHVCSLICNEPPTTSLWRGPVDNLQVLALLRVPKGQSRNWSLDL